MRAEHIKYLMDKSEKMIYCSVYVKINLDNNKSIDILHILDLQLPELSLY